MQTAVLGSANRRFRKCKPPFLEMQTAVLRVAKRRFGGGGVSGKMKKDGMLYLQIVIFERVSPNSTEIFQRYISIMACAVRNHLLRDYISET